MPDSQFRPTYAEINLDAVRHNFRLIKDAAGSATELLAIVKADAYGHSAVEVSRVLAAEGASLLVVAMVEEAIELRQAGIEQPILVMGAVWPGQETYYLEYKLTPYLFDIETARRLDTYCKSAGTVCPYHLKVDTGMGRLGVPFESITEALESLSQLKSLRMEGVMTHFALADEPEERLTDLQVERFRSVLEAVRDAGFDPRYIHAANSAGIFTRELPECNLARPGIALYGGWPSHHFEHLNLVQVMSLRTRIAKIKTVPTGAGVSYGHKFRADRPTRVATLPVGYADGYNRLLTNRGEALVRGQRVPVIGTVCMDWIMLDVTDVDGVAVGDEVTLLGNDQQGNVIRAEEWAAKIGTINYEVFCGISKRVPRVFLTTRIKPGSDLI
ncbi:MAG: alanine racemase [Desulfuromonas sp.]|nr:MAG: alanine racemase [Desulfuromonas sp.]